MSVHDHRGLADLRRVAAESEDNPLLWGGLLILGVAAALWFGWVGFIASDDSLYYQGAVRWLDHPPFAGNTHWSTRFPLTLAFAGMIAALGRGYAAFAATALLFYALLILVTGRVTAAIATPRAGWIAALLTATLPVVVSHATTVSVDLVEASALLLGASILGGAGDDAAGRRRGLVAGIAFGIAMLCRETTALPLVGLLPLFLLGRPVPRRVLVAAGIGFVLVIGAEAAFQYAMTGEPLRRYAIAFHHDEHIDRARNLEGNFLLWPPIDPLLVLLVNDDFGLLFWAAGAALAARAANGIGGSGRDRLAVITAMAVAGFVLVGLLYSKLVLNPRYFMVPALAALILVAIWLDRMRPTWRLAGLVLLVGSGLALSGAGNAHPRWPMEALLSAAAAHPAEDVAGPSDDVRRAALPLSLGASGRLIEGDPAPGGLVVVTEDQRVNGEILARYPSPPTRLGAFLSAVGVSRLLPRPVARRLLSPNPTMVLVRTPRG